MYYWKSPDLGIQDWTPLALGETGGVNAALRREIEALDRASRLQIALHGARAIIEVRIGRAVKRYCITGTVRPRYNITLLDGDNADAREPRESKVMSSAGGARERPVGQLRRR